MARALRYLVAAMVAFEAALCLFVIFFRLRYPFELEWMTGSVLDHIERIRHGLPVYAAPSADWIPFLYTPLYYYVAGAFTHGFIGCRLLSIAALVVQACCVHQLTQALVPSRFWRWIAVGLLFAAFPFAGWWYDIERPDTLFVAILMVSAWLLVRFDGLATAVAGGALLGLAFFAKQTGLIFFFAAVAGLLLARQPRRAAVALACGSVVLLGVGFALQRQTAGWFWYYAVAMPRAHGVVPQLWGDVLRHDLALGIGLLGATVVQGVRCFTGRSQRQRIFVAFLLAGLVTGLGARLHIGGWINVLQSWSSFACVAVAVTAAELETSRLRAVLVSLAVGAQLALWIYSPRAFVPRGDMEAGAARLEQHVADLERSGEVLFVGRGHVTQRRHFHIAALVDDFMANGRTPPDVVQAVAERRFAAIVDDLHPHAAEPGRLWPPVSLDEIPDLRPVLIANYSVDERVDERIARMPMLAPAYARWVLVPRAQPLDPHADLERAWATEMAAAAARPWFGAHSANASR